MLAYDFCTGNSLKALQKALQRKQLHQQPQTRGKSLCWGGRGHWQFGAFFTSLWLSAHLSMKKKACIWCSLFFFFFYFANIIIDTLKARENNLFSSTEVVCLFFSPLSTNSVLHKNKKLKLKDSQEQEFPAVWYQSHQQTHLWAA